jgi:CDP-diglyceride synthetase
MKPMSENTDHVVRERLSETHTTVITRAQQIYVSWYVDVLIYTIVLNLFDQFTEVIFFETFLLSILTALLLKLLLVLIDGLVERVRGYFEQKEGTAWKIVGIVVVFGILIVGKLFILEAVNFIFGDRVELGHFVSVIVLILTMIITRELAEWIYHRLGKSNKETEKA